MGSFLNRHSSLRELTNTIGVRDSLWGRDDRKLIHIRDNFFEEYDRAEQILDKSDKVFGRSLKATRKWNRDNIIKC